MENEQKRRINQAKAGNRQKAMAGNEVDDKKDQDVNEIIKKKKLENVLGAAVPTPFSNQNQTNRDE